ncbi:MAG TPA: hypothetical protein PK507_03965, partial [bacterium]|nr:hypothetical protein [bacterium]
YGSENNVENKDFDITNALEDKDILGSLQYIINQYNNFIKEIDEDGNVVLDETAFSYSEELKKIVNQLYDMDGTYSYQYKFKKILEELYVDKLNSNEKETEDDDDTFSFLKLQKIVLDYIPYLYELECKIVKMERIIESINNDLYGNIDKDMENIKTELDNLKYNTKCRKFEKFNFTSDDIQFYQTENNPSGYRMPLETGLTFEKTSNIFEENFITSVLDDNYDGDINLHRTDSFYNIPSHSNNTRMTGNYIIDKQNYFDLPDENIEYQLVFDPILKRPIYRYNTINMYPSNDYFGTISPLLEYYLNDNNYILQNTNCPSSTERYFNTKNIMVLKDNAINNLFRKSDSISGILSDQYSYNFYYFPSLYNSGDMIVTKINYYFDINDENSLNYDYFTGIIVVDIGIEQSVTNEGEGGDDPEPTPTFSYKPFWLFRNSYYIFNPDPLDVDDYSLDNEYITNKANNRFESNNHNMMAHNYYSGLVVNNGSLQGRTYNNFITKLNNYITRLNTALNGITPSIKYPKIDYTDILLDTVDVVGGAFVSVVARIGTTSNIVVYEYNDGKEYVSNNPDDPDPASHNNHVFNLPVDTEDIDLDMVIDSVDTPQSGIVYTVNTYNLDGDFTLTKALTDIIKNYNDILSVTPNVTISKTLPSLS